MRKGVLSTRRLGGGGGGGGFRIGGDGSSGLSGGKASWLAEVLEWVLRTERSDPEGAMETASMQSSSSVLSPLSAPLLVSLLGPPFTRYRVSMGDIDSVSDEVEATS